MRTILLSFDTEWFERLENNRLKFEYRKVLPAGELKVYFYVSSPTKAISGIAHFGDREELSTWLEKYSDRAGEVTERIHDYLQECRYAIRIKDFQKTNKITLTQLKNDIPDFIVPRMYYYLDNTELLEYLENNLVSQGEKYINTFDVIEDDDICK